MRTNWQSSAVLAALLGMAFPAAAQTSGGGSGGTGSSTSSPGVGVGGQSETGVGIPGDAPVDNRTLQPLPREPTPGEPGVSSSGTGAGPSSAAESMETHLSHKAPSKRLRDGLSRLHAANQAEIAASKLAEQSASSPEVKSFAQHMVQDHGKNDEQLAAMAGPRVDLRSRSYGDEAAGSIRDLKGKSGSSFDQAYMTAMVRDHRQVLSDVKRLASQAHAEGANDWADFLNETATAVQSHLTDAERIRSQNTAATDSTTGTGTEGGKAD